MNTQEKLEALGLKHWQKGDFDRIYINERDLKAVFGVEIEYYKTGNFRNVTVNGERISNSDARKIFGDKMFRTKIFFDCKTQKFNTDLKCIL